MSKAGWHSIPVPEHLKEYMKPVDKRAEIYEPGVLLLYYPDGASWSKLSDGQVCMLISALADSECLTVLLNGEVKVTWRPHVCLL